MSNPMADQATSTSIFKSLSTLKISAKIPLIIVAAAATLAVSIGMADYFNASEATRDQVHQRLESVVESRKSALND